MNNLKEIFQIQKVLKDNGYFDISRISNEIYQYCKRNTIPIQDVLEKIKQGHPWEHISGIVKFCGNDIFVTKDTLIPRIETEQIVDIALDIINEDSSVQEIVDVGCGSACIIISIAKEKSNLQFLATDISKEALVVAKKNVKANGLEGLISLKERNLLGFKEISSNSLIIANLPYIPTKMYENLDSSVKDFEPRLALDGKDDGLFYYKELIANIEEGKESNIYLLIEIEPSTLSDLQKYTDRIARVYKDFRGKNRFVLLHFS
jgi:release factor glutamine methyltransferase